MVELKNIEKNYTNFDLKINLKINKGEIFGLIGQSGSGKSTILRIIQGILKADKGEINIAKNTEIAYIFQEFNLLYNKNVFDNVALPLILKKKFSAEKVEEVLKLLPKLLNSGGRVGIITFHSLEDKIVKNYFKEDSKKGLESKFQTITKKPLDGAKEDVNNPRARSAKLRVSIRK